MIVSIRSGEGSTLQHFPFGRAALEFLAS